MDIYFVLWVIIQYYVMYFVANTFQYLTSGSFSICFLHPSDYHIHPIAFEILPYFWY